MVGSDTSLWGGLAAAAILFVINFTLKKLMFKFPKFSDFMQEKPEILIHNGKLDFKSLSKLNITSDELREASREHGVEHFSDVKLAMLEIDGNISTISGEKKPSPNALQKVETKQKNNGIIVFNFNKREKSN